MQKGQKIHFILGWKFPENFQLDVKGKYISKKKKKKISLRSEISPRLHQAFEKVVKGFKAFTIFTKSSILDDWRSSQYASDIQANSQNKGPSLTNLLWDKNAICY